MQGELDLPAFQARVERAIGRNMLVLQRLELLLKFIVKHCRVEGDHDHFVAAKGKQDVAVTNSTLGGLVGKFVDEMLRPASLPGAMEDFETPARSSAPQIALGFSVTVPSDFREAKRSSLAHVVAQRNRLIHHFLPSFDLTSVAGCGEALKHLEEQQQEIFSELEFLRHLADGLRETKQKLAAFLATPEFEERLLHPERFPAQTRRPI